MDDRDIAALTEYMTVLESSPTLPDAPAMYAVVSPSGSEYHVDLRSERCECPDHKYREVRCKHIRRCEYETGCRPLPTWVDREDLPADFARHVEGEPVREDEPQLRARVQAAHGGEEVVE